MACDTCGKPAAKQCDRCSAQVCQEHGGTAWCQACEAELKDELEYAVAEATLYGHAVIQDRAGRTSGLTLFTMLANRVMRPWRIRDACALTRRQFAARPLPEILAARAKRAR